MERYTLRERDEFTEYYELFAEHVANYRSEHIYLRRNIFHMVDITFGPHPFNILR